MTSQPKKISLSSSTLVDLKAELLRKQQEFRKDKLKAKGNAFIKQSQRSGEKKESIWTKSNAGILDRAQKDLEAKNEENATIEKSRVALEAKAKLYEKIHASKDFPVDDNGDLFLVDFQRKAMEESVQQRQEARVLEENGQEEAEKQAVKPAEPEEEWVDYVDQYGKSRTCLRRDLEDLQGQVRPLKVTAEAELLSEDMKRELLRQKWEQEEEELLNRPAGPIHYSNVQFDEVRSHGAAYYQFSKEEEQRKDQMEKLQDLRNQTLEQRQR